LRAPNIPDQNGAIGAFAPVFTPEWMKLALADAA
jgi:hypothetical protein